MKILVIDDSATIIKLIKASLTGFGYEIITVMEGLKGIEAAEKNIPDLILLDVLMSDMDGFEVCGRLKKTGALKDIPVIFLTSLTETDSIVKGFEAGAIDYILKPFNKLELLARVKIHLELTQSRRIIKEQEQRLSFALDGSEIGVWDWDIENGVISYSDKIFEILVGDEKLPGKTYFEFVSYIQEEYKKQFESTLHRLIEGKIDEFYSEFPVTPPLGSEKWILSRGKVIEQIEGKPIRITGTHTDITRLKSDQAKIMILSQAVEQSASLIMLTDPEEKIEYVNQCFTRTTGYLPEEVIGHNPRILKSGESSSDIYHNLWKTISSGEEWRGEFHNKKKNGEMYWASATINPIFNEKGAIIRYLAIQEDITEKKIHHDELNYYATTDILTQALNRRTGIEILKKQMNLSRRQGRPLAISFIDINNLKWVNDTFGHSDGDRYITIVSQIIQQILRGSDTICRLGGDEFLLIFPDCQFENAEKILHRIDERLAKINMADELPYKVSISSGRAQFLPDSNLTLNELIGVADTEMYRNKKIYKDSLGTNK